MESRKLKMDEILDYMDGPIIFSALDEEHHYYICSFATSTKENTTFLCTLGIPEVTSNLTNGEIDLLEFIQHQDSTHFSLTFPNDDDMAKSITREEIKGWLPLPGYYVNQ